MRSAVVDERMKPIRNYVPRPYGNSGSGNLSATSVITTTETRFQEDGQAPRWWTRRTVDVNSSGNWAIAWYFGRNMADMPVMRAGDRWLIGCRIQASKTMLVQLAAGYGNGSATAQTHPDNFEVGPVARDIWAIVTMPSGGGGQGQPLNLRVVLNATTSGSSFLLAGDWIQVTNPMFTDYWAPQKFRDGSFTNWKWLGSANASQSAGIPEH